MIVFVSLFLYAPLAISAMLLCLAAAAQVLRGEPAPTRAIAAARIVLVVLWASALVLAVAARVGFQDWVHLYGSAQIPLVGAFLGSGALLVRSSSTGLVPRKGPWLFLLMMLSLGLLPLLLEIAIPEDSPSPRDVGEPVRRLRELAAWGFGGPLPEGLAPGTDEELARGVGHLPREVTVPMGTTLIAAWLWIGFCALAFLSRVVRAMRLRTVFELVSPFLLVLVLGAGGGAWLALVWGGFEPGAIGPVSSRDSGIWTSDPAVLRSYGPVLLAMLIAALLLVLVSVVERLRSVHVARLRSSPTG